MRRRRLVRGLVLPLLANAFLAQIIVTLSRIAISYEAANLSLSPSQILVLSSSFSVLPAVLAVAMGRYNDGHGNGTAAFAGTSLMVLACAILILPPPSAAWLLLASVTLGLGQTFQLTGLQGEVAMMRRDRHRERIVGGLMVWQAAGQVSAPVLLSLLALSQGQISTQLAVVSILMASTSVVLSTALWRNAAQPKVGLKGARGIRGLLALPDLIWVMVAGSLCVAVHDLLLIYLPVIGPERDIAPAEVGILLALSAGSQTASRALFPWAVRRFGAPMLMQAGVMGTALSTAALVLPLGIAGLSILLAISGLSMGLAISSSVLLTMSMAPVEVRGTGLGLRLAVNRAAQFLMPLASGAVAAVLGADVVFVIVGLIVGLAGLVGLRVLPRARSGRRKR